MAVNKENKKPTDKICVTVHLPPTFAAKFRAHAMSQCGNISFWVQNAIDEKMKKELEKNG